MEPSSSALLKAGLTCGEQLPLGGVLGVATLVECHPAEDLAALDDAQRAFGGFRPGRWAWRMEAPRLFPAPFQLKGRLGLFDVDLPEGVAA